MKVINHWAVFISNNTNSELFAEQILIGKAAAPFNGFNDQKGVLFSNSLLNQLLEEEAKRDFSEVTKHIHRQLRSLSSGEQKKALLDYLLVQKPDFIILDNPFDNLDKTAQYSLQFMLAEIAEHTTLIQLISRKKDLLSFINNAVSLENDNKVTQLSNISVFLEKNNGEEHFTFVRPIPPPIHHYMMDSNELIFFNKVSVKYDQRLILKDISWTIKRGEFWQLIGPNGSGKTTLLTMITGDNVKGYGKDLYLFGRKKGTGETVWEIKDKIGYVTPAMTDLFSTRHTLEEMIVSGFFDSIGLYVKPSEMEMRLADEWLSVMEMEHLRHTAFCELSLGLQRKALIARAMVKHPPLLILDEPAFGLDDHNTAIVTALIKKIAGESSTAILYVSHRTEANLTPEFVFELIPTQMGSIGIVR